MRELAASALLGLFAFACAPPCPCAQPPAEAPVAEAAPPVEAAPTPTPPPASTPAPVAEATPPPPKEDPKPAEKPAAPDPQFAEGSSVAAAIKAVPVGSERANIDQETLAKPIQDFAVYEPCKPGTAHIKMKIAVWDGKAVGLDVTATPKNDKLVACVKERLKSLTWQAHVKSLNTVEYSF